MKHSKANTITLPVFVNNKSLHTLTPISEDTEISNICGGGITIKEFETEHLLIPFMGLAGLVANKWYPGALITSVPLVTALIALPAYISHKVTKKKYEKKPETFNYKSLLAN